MKRIVSYLALALLATVLVAGPASAQTTETDDEGAALNRTAGLIALAVALAVGLTGFATAWAEKEIGTAAMGAVAENPDLFGRGLIYMVLPETIVVFGFVLGFLVWLRIPA